MRRQAKDSCVRSTARVQNPSRHRTFDALERETPRRGAGHEIHSLFRGLSRNQYLARRRLGFEPGSQIDRSADRREVAAEGRELTDLDLTGVNADADPGRVRRSLAATRRQLSERRPPA